MDKLTPVWLVLVVEYHCKLSPLLVHLDYDRGAVKFERLIRQHLQQILLFQYDSSNCRAKITPIFEVF